MAVKSDDGAPLGEVFEQAWSYDEPHVTQHGLSLPRAGLLSLQLESTLHRPSSKCHRIDPDLFPVGCDVPSWTSSQQPRDEGGFRSMC